MFNRIFHGCLKIVSAKKVVLNLRGRVDLVISTKKQKLIIIIPNAWWSIVNLGMFVLAYLRILQTIKNHIICLIVLFYYRFIFSLYLVPVDIRNFGNSIYSLVPLEGRRHGK